MDDFWLYDLPVNPMNVPTVLVFNRPNQNSIFYKNPKVALNTFISRLGKKHRCSLKIVKIFGKYFF